jgi:2-iminobutanoate/2-iminopropanoate deaminase
MTERIAVNPDNVWKPELYLDLELQPGADKAAPDTAGWAQGNRKGNFIFISGQTGTLVDGRTIARDVRSQTRQALVNFKNTLEAAGGTMDDVVLLTYYFKQGRIEEGLAALRELDHEFFRAPFPARTCIEVVRVSWEDHLLELEGIAIVD